METQALTTALVAMSPSDMVSAQQQLAGEIGKKRAKAVAELEEADTALKSAIAHKWGTTALKAAVNRLARQVTFYDKIGAAVAAGYVIMPTLDMDVIAVRTRAKEPRGHSNFGRHFPQPPQALPQGMGENRDPIPFTEHSSHKDGDKTVHEYWATEWDDELVMPIELCKPIVLERTQEALAMKLFDEVGVVRERRYGGDPIVVGNILNPRRRGRRISFFIAWVLPLADL